jgi:hypothetical protein
MLPRQPLFRLLAINAMAGVALAAIVVTAVLALDVSHIGTMLLKDRNPAVALAVLFGSFVVTCASVMMGTAIMMLARDGEGPDRGLRQHGELVPIPVRVHRPVARNNLRNL